MTPADLAKAAALSFECKKDSMRQNQSGDWKIAFTVQGIDVPDSLTKAFPGTRYMAVLVQIGDDEQPVPAKEVMPVTSRQLSEPAVARPELENPPARAKREWRDLLPAQQAGMRCEEAAFVHFLREVRPEDWHETQDTADCVRLICGVESRSELNTNQRARVIWHQLDEQYQAWKQVEHA